MLLLKLKKFDRFTYAGTEYMFLYVKRNPQKSIAAFDVEGESVIDFGRNTEVERVGK